MFASWSALRWTAELCLAADGTTTLQAVCNKLATYGLGSIVEACDSAVPFFAGSLRDMAEEGALGLRCSAACCTLYNLLGGRAVVHKHLCPTLVAFAQHVT